MNYVRFAFLAFLKTAGYIIYPSKLNWLSKTPDDWGQVSLILILNHTSLFEFVYGVALPFRFLWELSRRLVMPVADSTLNKPLAGFVFSRLASKTIALTRKRDESWQKFLAEVTGDDICIFMPEGQMKRRNGLDKNGKPMVVKQGVYELLLRFSGKNMVIVYSNGLHHVLAPGDRMPKFFKRVEAQLEYCEVDHYLKNFIHQKKPGESVAKDLQERRDRYCGISVTA